MVRLRTASKYLKDYAEMLRALYGALPVHGPSIRQLAEDADSLADSLMQMANEKEKANEQGH